MKSFSEVLAAVHPIHTVSMLAQRKTASSISTSIPEKTTGVDYMLQDYMTIQPGSEPYKSNAYSKRLWIV